MMILKIRFALAIVCTLPMALLREAHCAVVLDVTCAQTDAWDFNYETNTLTFVHTAHEVPTGYVSVEVLLDQHGGDVTLSIVENLTNVTGAAWTGYILRLVPSRNTGARIIPQSAQSSDFAGVVHSDISTIEFVGPGTILPGETTTMWYSVALDLDPDSARPAFWVIGTPIPEPGTLIMFATGSMVLVFKRRSIMCYHVFIV